MGKSFDAAMTYAKSLGFNIFRGIPLLSEQPDRVMLWEEGDTNWKEFLDVAKAEGAKTIVVNKEYGEGARSKEVGSITLAWVKDGIVYLYQQMADWFEAEH